MINNRNNKPNVVKPKDEYAIILDVISDNSNNYKSNDTIQAIGTKTYALLELVAKPGVEISNGDKVYIGDGKRDEIQFIKKALSPNKLSASAKSEILFTIQDIIDEREEEYINFLNVAGPITIRQHAFELIPGIGKKHLMELIQERDSKKFSSFKEVKDRCSYLADPQKLFATRILDEIKGNTEHKFFIIR